MQKLLILIVLGFSALAFSTQRADAKLADDIQGTLLVVSKTENSVAFIDIASGSMVTTLPTGEGPHELVISEDGLWAVVSDFVGGDSLTIIDIANQKVARTIDLSAYPRPHGIQFLANPNLVAATSGGTNKLIVADIHKGVVVSAIDTTQQGTHMVAVQPETNTAYTSNMRSNTLAVLDLTTNSFVKAFSVAQTPEAIRLSPSFDEIWYGANKQGMITVIDALSGENIAEFTGFSFPYRVLFTPDGQLAAVPDYRNDYVRFFDAQEKRELGTLDLGKGAGPQGITLHPQGDIFFLSLNTVSEVVAIDVATRKIVERFKSGLNPDGIGYTPLVFGN